MKKQTPSLPVPRPANDATREKQIPFRQTDIKFWQAVILACLTPQAHAAVFLTEQALVESATFAADSRFSAVGEVQLYGIPVGATEPRWISRGSATLVSSTYILTAAHVADSINASWATGRVSDMRISFGANSFAPVSSAQLSSIFIHPEWRGGNPPHNTPDLALIRLSEAITTILPAMLATSDPTPNYGANRFEPGPTYYMAEYGMSGIMDGDLNPSDGIKRAGANMLEWYGPSYLGTTGYMGVTFDTRDAVPLEWKGSPGDSGGGWFADEEGVFRLAAVSSWAGTPYTWYGSTGATRVTPYSDWINSYIAIPEPTTSLLLLLAPAFLCIRRRVVVQISERPAEQAVTPDGL